MKSPISFLAAALLLTAAASADWVVESKVEESDGTVISVTKLKGEKVRYDMPKGPLGPASTIFDGASGDWIMIMHGVKSFQKESAAQMKQSMDAIGSGADARTGGLPTFILTGEKGKICDFDCEIYAATDQRSSIRLWVATSHPQAAVLKAVDKFNTRLFPVPALDDSALPGVVLKNEMVLDGNKTTVTVVSVKEQNVDAAEFEAPAGYEDMANPGFPGGSTPGKPGATGVPPTPRPTLKQRIAGLESFLKDTDGVAITLTPQPIGRRYGAGFPAAQMPADRQSFFWVVNRPDNETKVSALHTNQWHFSTLPGAYKIRVEYRSGDVKRTVSNVLEITIPGAASPTR